MKIIHKKILYIKPVNVLMIVIIQEQKNYLIKLKNMQQQSMMHLFFIILQELRKINVITQQHTTFIPNQ